MTAVLLSGPPGCGKTTLIRKVVASLDLEAGGFYTEEVRGSDGRRCGFEIVTLDGRSDTLASVDIAGPERVGRYGVNVAGIDGLAVPAILEAIAQKELIVVDEIGKMEMLSPAFRQAVLAALDSGRPLLGSILLAPHPYADAVKSRPDVRVLALSEAGRAQTLEQVATLVREAARTAKLA